MRNKKINRGVKFWSRTLLIKITGKAFYAAVLFLLLTVFTVKFYAAPQSDDNGRVLVGGSFTVTDVKSEQNFVRSYPARLTNSPQAGRTRFDFDGDGSADLAAFTASSGI